MLTSLIALVGLVGPPSVAASDFRGWLDCAERGGLAIPSDVATRARGFRYVMVGGFRGDTGRGEFLRNVRELRALGVSKARIHFVAPSSDTTVEQNAEKFAAQMAEIANEGPECLVVVAHSRGACDVLAFALRNPEFASEKIEAMYLIQGPFGGSGLADYVMGEGPAIDDQLRRWPRLLTTWIGAFERRRMSRGHHGSLAALTHKASRAYWANLLAENPKGVAAVDAKVFYIETKSQPSKLRMILRATASYLTLHYGPNDGVVALGDQTLCGVGTSLGVIDAGHSDLSGRPSPGRRKLSKAITQAIVMAVGQPHD